MKRLFFLGAISLMAVACQRADEGGSSNDLNKDASAKCNNVLVTDFTKTNLWGTLVRTTCQPGPGAEAEDVPRSASANPLLDYNSSIRSNLLAATSTSKVKTKSVHFWFWGSNTMRLFKPVVYARIFVFPKGDPRVDQAKAQVASGDHYLGFDRGIFKDVYPYSVVNINHKKDLKTGKVTSSFNLENEVKKSVPVDSRIFVQFIVQSSPAYSDTDFVGGVGNARYAYADFVNNDDKLYQHYKIDMDDTLLGYEDGGDFFYK